MGLILKDKIPAMMVGFPTISDKYDVAPAVIDSAMTGTVSAGDVVVKTSTTGRYSKITTTSAVGDIAGFVLGTNVKVPTQYPATAGVQTYAANDAFNLFFRGGIACSITLGDGTTKTIADVKEGAQVAIFLGATTNALGKLTVKGAKDTAGTPVTATDITGAYFTGVVENKGTAANPVYVAEIVYKL